MARPTTTTNRPPIGRRADAARPPCDPVGWPAAAQKPRPILRRRCRAVELGQPPPRSNVLPPNETTTSTGRRALSRLPAARAARRHRRRAAARWHTSRPQWPAVEWPHRPRRVPAGSGRGSPPGPPTWWQRQPRHRAAARYRRLPGGLRPAQRHGRSPAARRTGLSSRPAHWRPSRPRLRPGLPPGPRPPFCAPPPAG